jgi:protein-L-isoaspartate(D-aspartate) O-methyltransferase
VKQAPEEKPLTWERPRFQERKAERLRMVAGQIEARGVKDGAVVEAMREVPRHRFVPDNRQGAAYADGPQPIGYGQTISQPYVVALMTELLNLKPGDRVLEIGTGSGYQAAVLSELTPCVYTVEILPELAQQAADRLRKLGYKTVETRQSDGYYGWKEHAPFDAIIVTAAAGHVPPPLIEQLKPGGRIVVPIGGVYETQDLVVVTKDMDGRLRTRSVLPVTFVPMTGEVQKEK